MAQKCEWFEVQEGSKKVYFKNENQDLLVKIIQQKNQFQVTVYILVLKDKILRGEGLLNYVLSNKDKWRTTFGQSQQNQIVIETKHPYKQNEDYRISGYLKQDKKETRKHTRENIQRLRLKMDQYEQAIQDTQSEQISEIDSQGIQLHDSRRVDGQKQEQTKQPFDLSISEIPKEQKLILDTQNSGSRQIQLETNPFSNQTQYNSKKNKIQTKQTRTELFFSKVKGEGKFRFKIIQLPKDKEGEGLVQFGVQAEEKNQGQIKVTLCTNSVFNDGRTQKSITHTFSQEDLVQIQVGHEQISWKKYLHKKAKKNTKNSWEVIHKAKLNEAYNSWRPYVYMSEKGTKIQINPSLD